MYRTFRVKKNPFNCKPVYYRLQSFLHAKAIKIPTKHTEPTSPVC